MQQPPAARGYAPMHEAKPLDEFETESIERDEDSVAEEMETPTWKTSRFIPAVIFCSAIALLGGIIFFATGYQSEEPLQYIRVEGNRELMSGEIMGLAAIDRKVKFFDIDLRQIESRIAKHGLVRSVSIRRELHPNTIVIHVEERAPLAMIRSANGEPILIDNDFRLFSPRKLSGLIDPNKLLAVPALSGITDKDTASMLEMAHIVRQIMSTGDSSLHEAIGELRRTPTGAYIIYTSFSQTPIFIGSPSDVRFTTSLEREGSQQTNTAEKLFDHQLQLLASLWKQKLRPEVWNRTALYIDARFNGQVIVRHKGGAARIAALAPHDSTATASASDSMHRSFHSSAITTLR